MDFTSIVLIQIAIFSCLLALLPTSRTNTSIKISAMVVLIILSMSFYIVPKDSIARIGMGAWLILLVLPISLLRRLELLVSESEYLAASKLAKWLRWLVPTDGMWSYHYLLKGVALAQKGQFETAREIFDRYRSSERTEMGRSITALLYRSTDRWQEYIDWVQQRLTMEQLRLDRGMTLVYYLRALAETGDLQRCIAVVDKLDRSQQMNIQQLDLLKMYILAYCGHVKAVTQSCQSILSIYPAEVHQFWIATAQLAAGKIEVGRRQLAKLRHQSTDNFISADIAWRLSQPLPDLNILSPADWEVVDKIEAEVRQEARYDTQIPDEAWTPVTSLLMAINILVFCAELGWQYKTGDKNFNFIELGGLIAPLVLAGEWWRIVTANFLHMGILHLGMNMFALFYLGKFVEYRLGSLRYLLAYLLAGLGSMATITYIDTRWISHQVTVGASGAIMGMLGTMGAIHLMGWRQAKVISAARQFQAVILSVVFQLVFDLTNGHTSIVGHFSGLIIGFVVGLILLRFGEIES